MSNPTFLLPQAESSDAFSMLSVSEDGYIRLSFAKLQNIMFIHLISGLDEATPAARPGGATPTDVAGYTEWISNPVPLITIGWDWRMDVTYSHVVLHRLGGPYSNIMLQDANQADIGQDKTLAQLEAIIDALPWQAEVQRHINTRYGC